MLKTFHRQNTWIQASKRARYDSLCIITYEEWKLFSRQSLHILDYGMGHTLWHTIIDTALSATRSYVARSQYRDRYRRTWKSPNGVIHIYFACERFSAFIMSSASAFAFVFYSYNTSERALPLAVQAIWGNYLKLVVSESLMGSDHPHRLELSPVESVIWAICSSH